MQRTIDLPPVYSNLVYDVKQIDALLQLKADKVNEFIKDDFIILKSPDGNIEDSGHNLSEFIFDTIDGGTF